MRSSEGTETLRPTTPVAEQPEPEPQMEAEYSTAYVESASEGIDSPQQFESAQQESEALSQYGETAQAYVEQQGDIRSETNRKIDSAAAGMNISPEMLSSASAEYGLEDKLAGIQGEADQLARNATREIEEARISAQPPLAEVKAESWKGVFETPAGERFQQAMRGYSSHGHAETRGRISPNYAVREFVRSHPEEATQFGEIFQKEHGRMHPDLERARQEIRELEASPPIVPPEDERYAELGYSLSSDPEYVGLRRDINEGHKMRVFGTTDFRSLPLERFIDLANTDANLTFAPDDETEREFRKRFPEKASLYDAREKERVYRDPDGMINRDRDPSFLKLFEPNHRGLTMSKGDALQEFAARYPKKAKGYAEKYEDLLPYTQDLKTEQGTTAREVLRSERAPSQPLVEDLRKAGIESRTILVENGGDFPEVVLLERNEEPRVGSEKFARVYRGISRLDGSLLEQAPYAMRTVEESGNMRVLGELRHNVDLLAKEPTYQHLLAYADAVRPHLDAREALRLEEGLASIEEGILDGRNVRDELVFKQIEHGGGYAESGLTPYLSATFDPYEAAAYGNGGIVVIDIPLSELEDFSATGKEVNLKGVLDPAYIRAVLPRKRQGPKEQGQVHQDLHRALESLYESTPANLYDDTELLEERGAKLAAEGERNRMQWEEDVELVRSKRIKNLVDEFPEVPPSTPSAQDRNVDAYTQAKRNIFDFYAARFNDLGRTDAIEDLDYKEHQYGDVRKFSRESVDDAMLTHLRTLVEHLEKRARERLAA